MSQITILTKKTQVGKPFVTLKDTPEFATGGSVPFDKNNVNGKTLAVEVRKLVKEKFPKLKFSITSDYSSLSIHLMAANFDIYRPEVPKENRREYGGINNYYFQNDKEYSPELIKVFKVIDDFVSPFIYNSNANDPFADRVDYNIYLNYYFGKWDKPYERIGGGEKPSKPSSGSFPSKPKTPVPEGKKALYEYGATVEYSTVKGKYNGKIVYIRWVASTEQFLYTVKNGDKTYSVYESKILGVLEDASPTEEPMPEVPAEPTPTTETIPIIEPIANTDPTPVFEQKYETNSWVLYNTRISRVKGFNSSTGLYKILEFDASNIDTEALTHQDVNESELSVDLAVNPSSNKIKWIYLDWTEAEGLLDSQIYTNWSDFQNALENAEINQEGAYDKTKVFFQWENGKFLQDRIDLGINSGDFNPKKQYIGDYLKSQTSSMYSNNFIIGERGLLSWNDNGESEETWDLINELLNRKQDLYTLYNGIIEDDDEDSEETKIEIRNKILATNNVIDELTEELSFSPRHALNTYFSKTTDPIMTDMKSVDKLIEGISFQIWFGNYKHSPNIFSNDFSSVIRNRAPMMVYHATTSPFPFTKYSFSKFPAMYFYDNVSYAHEIAEISKGIVYPCFLNIRFPLDATSLGLESIRWIHMKEFLIFKGVSIPEVMYKDSDFFSFAEFIRNDSPQFLLINAIKEAGYDGIIQKSQTESDDSGLYEITDSYLIFNPNQVKVFTNYDPIFGFNNIMYMKHGGKITDSKIIEKKVSLKNKLKEL